MALVNIPPRWLPHTIGDVRATHLLRETRDGWSGRAGEVVISAVHLPGGESAGMIAITLDGHTFYLKAEGERYEGGGMVAGMPVALVACVGDHGLVVGICEAEPVG
jgi:hypothetical protein